MPSTSTALVRLARTYPGSTFLATTLLTLFLPSLAHRARTSYRDFLALGHGALPPTRAGWLAALVCRAVLGRDAEADAAAFVRQVEGDESLEEGWLTEEDVPLREGERPDLMKYPIPQRHLIPHPSASLAEAQLAHLASLAARFPAHLRLGDSRLERGGPALFVLRDSAPGATPRPDLDLDLTAGELVHLHRGPYGFPLSPLPTATSSPNPHLHPGPAAESLHVVLCPRDAALVLRRGWGVRHPLASTGAGDVADAPCWLWRWLWGKVGKWALPQGYVLVYAPRDEREAGVQRRIVEAGVRWATGVEL
ncbi:hypothetical protein JCM10207_005069 [Rhodosporidiobolus poonsookiae]